MDIKFYREMLMEWALLINKTRKGEGIRSINMAVLESHLIRKISNQRGVLLCANYPDYKQVSDEDGSWREYSCVLYLVEKVPSGSMKEEEEIDHYEKIDGLMKQLIQKLESRSWSCSKWKMEAKQLKVEWEFDIFGGFNGQSLSFKLEDYGDD